MSSTGLRAQIHHPNVVHPLNVYQSLHLTPIVAEVPYLYVQLPDTSCTQFHAVKVNANFLLYCAQSAYVNKVVEEFMGDSAWFGEEDETVISFLEYASTLNLDDFTSVQKGFIFQDMYKLSKAQIGNLTSPKPFHGIEV